MPQYSSRVGGFKSRISHWVCKRCGTVFTKVKPTECTHCTSTDGYIYFPSRREFNRYKELKMMELAGLIDAGSLELQPRYKIVVEQTAVFDFRYTVHGGTMTIIEDVKTSGTNTDQSKARRKAAQEQHGIEVKLV